MFSATFVLIFFYRRNALNRRQNKTAMACLQQENSKDSGYCKRRVILLMGFGAIPFLTSRAHALDGYIAGFSEFGFQVLQFVVCPFSVRDLKLISYLMAKRAHRRTSGVSTLDIWPWKYLVPWMREDLFARRDARHFRGQASLATSNPYDMEDILMPLHDYINDPIAQDIIHNGATFQIAEAVGRYAVCWTY